MDPGASSTATQLQGDPLPDPYAVFMSEDPDLIISPGSRGGILIGDLRVHPFTDAHYAQRDTTLNEVIWGVFPVGKSMEELVVMRVRLGTEQNAERARVQDIPSGPGDVRVHKELALISERSCVVTNYAQLLRFADVFPARGIRVPAPMCRDPQYANCGVSFNPTRLADVKVVQAVEMHVRRAETAKEIGDGYFIRGDYKTAAAVYHLGLVLLYPWTATPLLFGPHREFNRGPAIVEAALWLNLARALDKDAWSSPFVHRGLRLPDPQWNMHANNAVDPLWKMKYITHTHFAHGVKLAAKIEDEGAKIWAITDRSGDEYKAIIALKLASISVRANNPFPKASPWAHEFCIGRHICANAQVYERVSGLSQSPVYRALLFRA